MVYRKFIICFMAVLILWNCMVNKPVTAEYKPVQYRLRQIMVEPVVSQEREAEILKQAKECLKKALSGMDFTILARTFSQEPGARQTGGDLGFFEHENMVKPFSDAVFSMKPGEIRGSVRTQYGFHIIKLLEIQDDRRHAQHILFALMPGRSDTLAVLDIMSQIQKQLFDGEDFSEIFRRYNTNDLIRETEGYMVWQRPEEMLPSFAQAVKGLKPGEFSEPFVSILGFHIVLVDSINYNPQKLLEGFPPHIEEKLKKK